MCVIARHLAQLTKMQPKMQYENVFKVIGVVHVILAFLKLLLLLLKLI